MSMSRNRDRQCWHKGASGLEAYDQFSMVLGVTVARVSDDIHARRWNVMNEWFKPKLVAMQNRYILYSS